MAHAPEACGRCGSLLFPPHLAPELELRVAADFICPNCGRAYLWGGNPRTLSIVSLSSRIADEDDHDDDQSCRLSLSAEVPDLEPRPLRPWLVIRGSKRT
jgi:predicted RNA-binding Zn-ribbon protein involved in translation (DUF1610 family)